jgi:hypothetical protein
LQLGRQVEVRLLVGKGQRLEVIEGLQIVHCLEMLPDLIAGDFALKLLAESVDDANHEKVLKEQSLAKRREGEEEIGLTLLIPTGRSPCSARNNCRGEKQH